MFPFGNQSPNMFPQNVGPMQSPLFSMNNVPQTPYFGQSNGANSAFLPGPNPNAHNVGNHHHSSLSNYHSFGHTASTLPMPLSLPMQSMMAKDTNSKEQHSSNNNNNNRRRQQQQQQNERSNQIPLPLLSRFSLAT